MTKRFYLNKGFSTLNILDIKDEQIYCNNSTEDMNVIVGILNELSNENEQLRELLENGLEVSQVEIDEELERMNKNK